MIDQECFHKAYLVRKGTGDVLAIEGVAHRFPGETHSSNICPTNITLGVFSKQENPGISRKESVPLLNHTPSFQEDLLGRLPANPTELIDVGLHFAPMEVIQSCSGNHFHFEADLATINEQLSQHNRGTPVLPVP